MAKPSPHNPHGRRLHLPLVVASPDPEALGATESGVPGERKPPWLKVRATNGPNRTDLLRIVREGSLHTVCQEASCPNIHECWEDREATFLVLGDRCTRRCGFCDVMTAKPDPIDEGEPRRIADAVVAMGLRYAVITGVARDDLPDNGASMWARCVEAVHEAMPGCGVEVLPPDFRGDHGAIATVIAARPEVFAHNLETVRRLHPRIRPAFDYDRSLEVLRIAKRVRPEQVTKSNLILGMGESPDEVRDSMRDLVDAGCDLLTLGQYLRPTEEHLPVDRWVSPDEFSAHAAEGLEMGLAWVEAGPLVRSSYHAGRQYSRAARRLASR
jgi:lipoic acid synthetase